MSTYLVAFVVGPLEATEPVLVPRPATAATIPLRIIHVPGKGHLTAFGLDVGALRAQLVPGLLRHPVPHRQVRHARAARLRRRRDGEPRLHHLPREPAARRPGHGHAGRAADARRRGRARAGAHVVRRPGDDEVVERHLAERGVRHVHGDRLLRRLPARLAAVDHVQPRAQHGLRGRLAGQHPHRRVPGGGARRLRRHVRRAHLPEGRLAAAHARAVPRRGRVPSRRQPLPVEARVRQHRDQRPVGRHRGGATLGSDRRCAS